MVYLENGGMDRNSLFKEVMFQRKVPILYLLFIDL